LEDLSLGLWRSPGIDFEQDELETPVAVEQGATGSIFKFPSVVSNDDLAGAVGEG
jgi:hypothetical protein